jgi:hypothetical protein
LYRNLFLPPERKGANPQLRRQFFCRPISGPEWSTIGARTLLKRFGTFFRRRSVLKADESFAQAGLTPKRLASMSVFSRQSALRSSSDIETIVRQDLAAAMPQNSIELRLLA